MIFFSSNIAYSSTTVFVLLANNVNSENNDVKTVLASENIDNDKLSQEHPLTFLKKKKKTRDLRTKKGNNQKSKQKKQHLCHHYGATGHI